MPRRPKKGQPVRTTLSNGAVTAAYDGKFGYTSSEEGFYFDAYVAAEPKVVAVLKSGTSLTISIPGKQERVPLRGVALRWRNSRPPVSAAAERSLRDPRAVPRPAPQTKSRRNGREWMARQTKVGRLETLIAVAIAVGMLKGHAAPAAEPPQTVTAEHRASAGAETAAASPRRAVARVLIHRDARA